MSLRLLIDEDTQARRLVEILRTDGHNVLTVNEAGVTGIPDSMVLSIATTQQRTLIFTLLILTLS